MRRLFIFALFLFFSGSLLMAQTAKEAPVRLSIFVDCPNTWCDMTFIRSEIKGVNFSLDNQAADVHVLITSLPTGSGGNHFQLIFYGQHTFAGMSDTLSFDVDRNATEVESRDRLLYFLKSGLVPYVIRTKDQGHLSIDFKESADSSGRQDSARSEKDPWDYWIFRVGTDGNINADAVYRNYRYSANLSANRTTEKWKYGLFLNASKNQSSFKYDDGTGEVKFTVVNHDLSLYHYLVGSINERWSWAYDARISQNTFSNYKMRSEFSAGLEHNIYPYKQVNNKLFTIAYVLTAKRQLYYDTTIYNKLRETVFTQGLRANMNMNQKWGTLSIGLYGEHFLNNWNFFNLGINSYTNIRISGGLSFFVAAFGGVTRDQVFLPKGNASPQEVLARQRQLASGFSYYTSFGINFRFGSKLNNFVNPRFEGDSRNMSMNMSF
ncbi:MAG: hypothetical protein ACKO6Q_08125 [Bacteroidota bacterium]